MPPAPAAGGGDWANAASFLVVTLVVPVLATDIVLLDIMVGPGYLDDEIQLVMMWLPWFFWLVSAPYALWWVWQGRVTPSTLRVHPDRIVGRTSWPLRRWRSIGLGQLSRVRYHRRFWPQRGGDIYVNGYLALRDLTGARLAVTFDHRRADRDRDVHQRLCRTLLDTLDRSPYAQASDLTRRRLSGETSRAAVTLGIVVNLVLIFVVMVATLALTVGLLYWVGAIGPT